MVLYCNRGGLAARRLENCIAIQLLYCRLEWLDLCHNTMDCIVTNEGNQVAGLYRNTVHCIVTEAGHGLYCNTVNVPTTRPS